MEGNLGTGGRERFFIRRGGLAPQKLFCSLKCSRKVGSLKMDHRQCSNPTAVFQVGQDRFHLIAFAFSFYLR